MSIQSPHKARQTLQFEETAPSATDYFFKEVTLSGRGGEIAHAYVNALNTNWTDVDIKAIDGDFILRLDGSGDLRLYPGGTSPAQALSGAVSPTTFDNVKDSDCAWKETAITLTGASAITADFQRNFIDASGPGAAEYSCRNKTPFIEPGMRGRESRPTRLILAIKLNTGSGDLDVEVTLRLRNIVGT